MKRKDGVTKIKSPSNGDVVKGKVYCRTYDFDRDSWKGLINKLNSKTFLNRKEYIDVINQKIKERIDKGRCTLEDVNNYKLELSKKRAERKKKVVIKKETNDNITNKIDSYVENLVLYDFYNTKLKHFKIQNEIIDKLQKMVGIDINVFSMFLKRNSIFFNKRGFSENIVAMCLDLKLPKNIKGMDFKGIFEVKEIMIRYLKNYKMRTRGDTAVSPFNIYDIDFFESNVWDKLKSVLVICVDENGIIVDIRFFDGDRYANDMKNDYEEIKKTKNINRKSNKYLAFKTGRNSIMIKGSVAIDFSDSIVYKKNIIEDQEKYILENFGHKFHLYKESNKKYTYTAPVKRVIIEDNIAQYNDFDYDLPF